MKNYKLDVVEVKVKHGPVWAMRMILGGISRYRLYHYKKEATESLWEWENLSNLSIGREFNHNFDSAETLGISED